MVADSPLLASAWHKMFYHREQLRAWQCKKRFVAIPAGRGSGKTEMAKRKLVLALADVDVWTDDDPRYFYGAPTVEQAKRIAWHHFLRLIPKEWIAPNGVNNSSLIITTVFGSKLHIVGLDKPQRIEGDQWDGCVLDESCDLKPGVFHRNVLPALAWHSSGNAWCWRIGVPKRTGPGAAEFREFFEEAISGKDPNSAGFSWPSGDIIPAATLDYARNHLDAMDFAEQFDAQFQNAGGGIFSSFDKECNCRPCIYNPDMSIIVASDFNVTPMAWVFGHDYGNYVEWFDELWLRDCTTPKALSTTYDRYRQHRGGFVFYGDATSRSRTTKTAETDYLHILAHEGFRQLGREVNYPAKNPALKDRFAACNAMFCNANGHRRMFVDKLRCPRLIKDLEQRTYKEGTCEPDDADMERGHITDAMGYAIHMLYPISVMIQGKTIISSSKDAA